MSDHRLEQVENELGSLAAGQKELQQAMRASEERLLKHMENMFAHFSTHGGGHDDDAESSRGPGCSPSGGSFLEPKITKLDFPRYDGIEDPTGWICRVEQFFEFQYTKEAKKLPMAGYHLDGDVQLWYQRFKHQREAAISLARLYKSRMYDQWKRGYVEPRKALSIMGQPPLPSASLARARNLTIKRLSPTELQERRTRKLCFNCYENFSPGHRCKKLFLIKGIFPSIDELLDETTVEEEEDIPEISFHAILGNAAPQTMRFVGKIGDSMVRILLDSGSTHNFLNSQLGTKMGIYPTKKGRILCASG
ncbi:hypothetical protein F0562_011650 [Nyssa sinensis]|uniref:Retrotransposon gag domain-containing protein n=1 Tax=Nyssa sinensis TaxID=561372 RepID=A0A5J4ZV24_9ASTE|nr:hypothetical protein F0562_011650 [Nyssa sinensis]